MRIFIYACDSAALLVKLESTLRLYMFIINNLYLKPRN